jgi:hypothetical protein
MSQINQKFYDLNEHKRLFYVAAEEIANKSNARKVYRKKDIEEIIETLKKAKSNPNKKSANEYYLLSTFQVMEIAGIEKLIKKLKYAKDTQEIKQICPFPLPSTPVEIPTIYIYSWKKSCVLIFLFEKT